MPVACLGPFIDIRQYTLDSHGFQIYPHTATEKDFVDDEQIKAGYYPETEQLLKDASVHALRIFVSILADEQVTAPERLAF